MKFGVRLPNSGPFATKSSFARIGKECARLNYDALWVHDHMHWGVEDATHFAAGSAEAVKPGTYQNFFESITTLAHLSNIENIRFGIAPIYTSYQDIYHAVIRMKEIVEKRIYLNYSTSKPIVT